MTVLIVALMMQAKTCPWMNQATAEKILGGQTAVKVAPRSCEFNHGKDYLHIETFSSSPRIQPYLGRCRSGPDFVKGIGNEAVVCEGANHQQIAIGRVRDQVFVLRLKAPFSRDLSRAKIRAAADLVSGNLY